MKEPLPLSNIQTAVVDFLRERDDAVLFGAHAVNAYVAETRMSQDVDVQSTRAAEISEELRAYLHNRFHIAIRTRELADGRGYRLYQSRAEGNRYLVDIRPVGTLPPARRIDGVLVIEPAALIAGKVVAYDARRGRPKSGTDWRDLAMLLLAFPELKSDSGPVSQILAAGGASPAALQFWRELVAQQILPPTDDDI